MPNQGKEMDPRTAQMFERSLARQRWARAGWIYGSMMAVGVVFIGVFYVAFITSLKTNPLEWPFKFSVAQLNPQNWVDASRLGNQGANNIWLGGFGPNAEVKFDLTYFVPADVDYIEPEVIVPDRDPGSRLVALRPTPKAANFSTMFLNETGRRDGNLIVREETVQGELVSYKLTVTYDEANGQGQVAERLPVDIETPRGYVLTDATLLPDRIERRGRVASWDSLTPGFLGYTFKNYIRTFRESYDARTNQSLFWRWTVNSFFIAVVKVLTTLLFASMAGYALARLRFPGRKILFFFILFSMMVPAQVTFISNYLVMRDAIGLNLIFPDLTFLNNSWGVIIAGMVGAGSVFIMKQFFESVPRSIEEAALIDGANPGTTFFRVVLPMATPALGALTILTFQGAWNEFFWPLVVLTQRDSQTLPVGLLTFRTAYGPAGDWGLILAGAFFSMIPVIILFIIFQRYFVEGVSMSGVKG